jgi:hypothetical protein
VSKLDTCADASTARHDVVGAVLDCFLLKTSANSLGLSLAKIRNISDPKRPPGRRKLQALGVDISIESLGDGSPDKEGE